MSDPFVAEIRVFFSNFAPRGWAFCNGQLMAISQNTAVFSLLGTYYGGDGKSNFALPDLQERIPLGATSDTYSGFSIGEQREPFAKQRSTDVAAKRPKKKAQQEPVPAFNEITEGIDQDAQAAELKKLAEILNDSQKQVQQMLESQTEIVNHILKATTQVTEYQEKSAAGEFGEAGASLKQLVKTIDTINRDPHALPKLQSAIDMLNDAQGQTQRAISLQTEIVDLVKTAATHVDDYRARTSIGRLSDAGASLAALMQTIQRLNEIWNKKRLDSPVAKQVGSETTPGFVGASFIIALQGVFPPRN